MHVLFESYTGLYILYLSDDNNFIIFIIIVVHQNLQQADLYLN